jgi:hypothetical protein
MAGCMCRQGPPLPVVALLTVLRDPRNVDTSSPVTETPTLGGRVPKGEEQGVGGVRVWGRGYGQKELLTFLGFQWPG